MARVTGDDQTCASTMSLLESRTSHLRDSHQTGCDVMSILVSQEADVLLANLAYGHDNLLLATCIQMDVNALCCPMIGCNSSVLIGLALLNHTNNIFPIISKTCIEITSM